MQEQMVKMKFGRHDLIIETGKIAKQANGSVTVQYAGTVVLVTACMSKEAKDEQDFFPLTVEYQEKTYAAGRIPGGFFKREGRPSESEILTARLIDRPIRPLFPKGLFNEVQVMAIVLSSDGENDPDILAVTGASAALSISDIPFNGPLATCRVGRLNNEFILNPTYAELESSDIDLVLAANKNGIVIIESKCKEVTEEVCLEAVKFGSDNLKGVLSIQEDFIRKNARAKRDIEYRKITPALYARVEELAIEKLREVYKLSKKEEREEEVAVLLKELEAKLTPEGFLSPDIKMALVEIERNQVRQKILNENVRIDGRAFKDIRPITCEVSVLPRTHGSSLFTRGQTQSLSITTLGTGEDEQLIEALEGARYKTFMLHYSFPPFSVGETAPVRGPGRREIGHGSLAEKSLLPVMPSKEQFPYTVRVVSEILESNGSSSMATVCASALSLMDAGVPIKEAVSGVALGLIKEQDKSIILTDITGLEDHFGDMDFKVAGSKNGITAVQLDLKIEGIDINLLEEALMQAKEARLFILEKMQQRLSAPRQELSKYAPRIERIKIDPEKIGELIGPSGKTIKKIINSTGVSIDVQEDGSVLIASTDASKSEEAIEMVKTITKGVEVGQVYMTKVKRITNFGVFCEITPGKDGLVHVSELADHFVKDVEKEVKIGDEFKVVVIGIDETGKIRLSKKQAQDKELK